MDMDAQAKLAADKHGSAGLAGVAVQDAPPARSADPAPFDARESARLTLQRYPKVMAKLAE